MDYGLRRAQEYKNLAFDEEWRDLLIMVAAHVVLDEPIRDEDRELLRKYLQVKLDIPKEDIPQGNSISIPVE